MKILNMILYYSISYLILFVFSTVLIATSDANLIIKILIILTFLVYILHPEMRLEQYLISTDVNLNSIIKKILYVLSNILVFGIFLFILTIGYYQYVLTIYIMLFIIELVWDVNVLEKIRFKGELDAFKV